MICRYFLKKTGWPCLTRPRGLGVSTRQPFRVRRLYEWEPEYPHSMKKRGSGQDGERRGRGLASSVGPASTGREGRGVLASGLRHVVVPIPEVPRMTRLLIP